MLCLPKPELVSVNIPFSGFYESLWSYMVDREEESFLEHVTEEPDRYSPEMALVAKRNDLGDLMWRHTQYSAAYQSIARDYADAYLWWLVETLELPVEVRETVREAPAGYTWTTRETLRPVRWEFEEMVSPRYYNFETDRLFVKIDVVLIRELFRQLMLVDKSWAFVEAVRAMFTSYDGFASHYDNDPVALKDKPLDEWDHNELKVLLVAWSRIQLGEDQRIDDELYEDIADDSYSYFSDAVDWEGLEEACKEKVQEYRDDEELTEEEQHRLENPRCPDTLELPL